MISPPDMRSPVPRANAESAEEGVKEIHKTWTAEFKDGARGALLQCYDGEREEGGYPVGFHRWPLGRRNAWFAGFNIGFHDRLRILREAS